MSDVINFLEAMGSNASSTRLSVGEFEAAVALLEISDGQQQALLDRDHALLGDLLGGRPQVLCSIFAPDEEKEDEQRESEEPVRETPAEAE
jgi:hypothetical protein